MEIILKGRIPSKKNSKRRIQRGRNIFMVPSREHQLWHVQASAQLPKLPKPLQYTSGIEFTLYAPDKRKADLSNKWESVADLLVDNGILADDNWFVVPKVIMLFGGVDKENPRVIIKTFE